jgi:CDP-paratose 2-epimerase
MTLNGNRNEIVNCRAKTQSLPAIVTNPRYVLITGGSGFIGSNLAAAMLAAGKSVEIFDNLSRPGVESNLRWLHEQFPERLKVTVADVRDPNALRTSVSRAEQVFHFAAQVSVTRSIEQPFEDFEINAGGTMNLLEAMRSLRNPPPLVFASTKKVYGQLEGISLRENKTRYEPTEHSLRVKGIDEKQSLEFHSPYGCSKGAADQYILDSVRTFDLPAVVFRMSCIYGPRQYGTEDQGWVAHFLIRANKGERITLYGDGKQVRDILFIDDLVRAFVAAQANMPRIRGQVFNIGGGAAHSVSLLELIDRIHEMSGERPRVDFGEWRLGDQRYYVSNTNKFRDITGWHPKVGVREGLRQLQDWLREQAAPIRVIPVPRIEAVQ